MLLTISMWRARAINTDYTVNENYIETVLHTH